MKLAPLGFVLLRDLQPSEAEVLALTDAPSSMTSPAAGAASGTPAQVGSATTAMAVDEDPQPPQPFEYSG